SAGLGVHLAASSWPVALELRGEVVGEHVSLQARDAGGERTEADAAWRLGARAGADVLVRWGGGWGVFVGGGLSVLRPRPAGGVGRGGVRGRGAERAPAAPGRGRGRGAAAAGGVVGRGGARRRALAGLSVSLGGAPAHAVGSFLRELGGVGRPYCSVPCALRV